MKPSVRGIRVLKWTGTVVCVGLVGLWIFSAWVEADYSYGSVSNRCHIGWTHGQLGFVCYGNIPPLKQIWRPGWRAVNLDGHVDLSPLTVIDDGIGTWGVSVALWLVGLIVLAPTLWLWYLDRRRPGAGHCRKCGYDLTGNISGVCPECGTAQGAAAS